jgi:hypothetical protein
MSSNSRLILVFHSLFGGFSEFAGWPDSPVAHLKPGWHNALALLFRKYLIFHPDLATNRHD